MKWMLATCLMLALCAAHASGESELMVGVKPAEPFIIVAGNGSVSEFSIDLLEHLVARLEAPVSVSYHVDPDIPTHLVSIKAERVDFGIAATNVTSERLGSFEFSHPFYLADLGIITEKNPRQTCYPRSSQETSYLASFWRKHLWRLRWMADHFAICLCTILTGVHCW